MNWVSTFIQRRGSWGIFVLFLWALVLALVSFARMLLLSAVVGVTQEENMSQNQVWLVFIVNTIFGLGFLASAYGLWIRRQWGRLLFIIIIAVWAIFYLIAIFLPQSSPGGQVYSPIEWIINLIPYLIGSIGAIWYLNLAHIKALFNTNESVDQRVSE
ncbi:MAG: hypothetical protein U0401_05855 [Anaerolineae bacterium]